jgi:dolichol-phosphate mannosyltransferase
VKPASRLYYLLMRNVVGLRTLAPAGADCVLLDRAVVKAVRRFGEQHVSLLALINWMGFRQVSVPCRRDPRARGRSGWTFRRKLELLVDSVTGFTYLPIRVMSYLGLATAATGLVYAVIVVANALGGEPPVGWSSLMVAVLLIGGVQMLMLGVLGEYVWRALEESRRRPRYLIEATTGGDRVIDRLVAVDQERHRA